MDTGENASPFSSERVEDVLDRMTDAFFGLDDEWRFTYLNEQARRAVCDAMDEDATAEELCGRVIWDAIPDLVGTQFEEGYREAMATQSQVSFEAEYEPLDTWFEVTAYPSDSGLSLYFRDVTERRRRREEIENRETVLREMYEVISDQERSFEARVEGLLAIGCRELGTDFGTLSRVRDSEYVFEVVRAPDDTIEAGDVVDLAATSCERVVLSEQRLVAGDVARDHPELAEKTGYTEWGISCYLGTPVTVDDDVYGTFCFYDTDTRQEQFSDWEVTLVDIMGRWVGSALERKLTAEQLVRQNERLEQFATIVSHDLRNPLGVATKRLDLVSQECDSDHLAGVERAHDRMEAIIDDVLAMAKAGTTAEDVTDVEIASVAREAWENVPTGDATLDVDDDLVVSCDPSRLLQLFENLFRNSVEHGGPDVTVQIAARPGGFVVADDGPGIPDDERDSVFEFGYSGSDGSGVGLAIVEQIAAAHGWTVTPTEDWGGGACFEFRTAPDR
jgi:GAF domain-containing protein